ncbi:MAG: alpha-ketoacid dehydrogenase subunit beta [Pseudomonadota bacterium]
MPKKTYLQAINEALHQEMTRDENVIVLGEDVAGGQGSSNGVGSVGSVFGQSAGLYNTFGGERVIDTPISESAIIGAANGAALTGLRPVAELMFVDFIGVCMDQVYNQAAKFHYMFGGKAKTPWVLRTTAGAGLRAGAQHSQTLHPLFTMIPGLKVVMPTNPYDAKGLLIEAIRDDDPVIFIESKVLFGSEGDVPDEAYTVPFGEAEYVREGEDATIVAMGGAMAHAMAAAAELAKEGVECEVVDPRTTSPLDEETILESVENTGRLIVVDESPPRCSMAADISSIVADKGFKSLKAPIKKVTCPHTPVPFAPSLEDAFLPNAGRVAEAVKEAVSYG